jgi:hypothetical protein
MVHTGVAWPYSACRSGSGLNEGLGRTGHRSDCVLMAVHLAEARLQLRYGQLDQLYRALHLAG